MIPVLTTDQIREADSVTIRREPVASIDLMERASTVFADWFGNHYRRDQPVRIYCGRGNNGGDGLAVARLLAARGYAVQVAVLGSGTASPDFEVNRIRLAEAALEAEVIEQGDEAPPPAPGSVIVDALFGSGLDRPLRGAAARLIEVLNRSDAERVAVDMPSGLYADRPMDGPFFAADRTLSFEVPKLAFFLPESSHAVGRWELRSIGLDPDFLRTTASVARLVEAADVSMLLPRRKRFDHKGTYGHALVAGGAPGKEGAAYLAAASSLRAGAGLSSIWPTGDRHAFNPAEPELMHFLPGPNPDAALLAGFAGIAMGPGAGTGDEAAAQFESLLALGRPVLLDADALNWLAADPARWKRVPARSVLTPHPGEFQRLFGPTSNGFARLERLKEKATEHGVTILLKGAWTAIANPNGKLFFNPTGNSGMATAGTGDVLAGVIAGLLAQGLEPEQAAIAGVYLHGLAGDLGAARQGFSGLIARDVIEELPRAAIQLTGQPRI